jgi:hypothetical protein
MLAFQSMFNQENTAASSTMQCCCMVLYGAITPTYICGQIQNNINVLKAATIKSDMESNPGEPGMGWRLHVNTGRAHFEKKLDN